MEVPEGIEGKFKEEMRHLVNLFDILPPSLKLLKLSGEVGWNCTTEFLNGLTSSIRKQAKTHPNLQAICIAVGIRDHGGGILVHRLNSVEPAKRTILFSKRNTRVTVIIVELNVRYTQSILPS
jgi:hypothetical protein